MYTKKGYVYLFAAVTAALSVLHQDSNAQSKSTGKTNQDSKTKAAPQLPAPITIAKPAVPKPVIPAVPAIVKAEPVKAAAPAQVTIAKPAPITSNAPAKAPTEAIKTPPPTVQGPPIMPTSPK